MEARLFTRRGVSAAAAGGAGALLASACGAPRAAGRRRDDSRRAPVTLSFWARGTQEFTDMMASIATAYAGANPTVTMDGGYFPSDGYNDRLVAAASRHPAGRLPHGLAERDLPGLRRGSRRTWRPSWPGTPG